MRLLRKLRSLKPLGRRVMLQMAFALPAVALAVRLVGFQRVHAVLGRLAGHHPPPAAEARRVRRTLSLLNYLAEHGPYRGNCLSRSLVLWWFLQRQGIVSRLRIGVRTEIGELDAHAWVEHQGKPVNAPPEVAERFAPYDQALVPEGASFT